MNLALHRFHLVVGAAAALSACAPNPHPLRVITTPGTHATPVMRLAWIDNYPRAVASVSRILERDVQLPPIRASLRFYGTRRSLESALRESGFGPELARDSALTLNAVGGLRQVLLNEQALGTRPWQGRVAILAHELTHAAEYQLAGGRRGASEQWLREGFCEWSALRVLEGLDAGDAPKVRAARLDALRRAPRRPSLTTLGTFDEWLAASNSEDVGGLVYSYAYIATDRLIDRAGLSAVLGYFRLFAVTDDRRWAFRTAFGEDVAAFDQDVSHYVVGRP